MNRIQEKLAEAREQYANALEALTEARQAHQEGPGKEYAQMLAVQADLKAKIEGHEAAATAAEITFKGLFAKANHVVTKEVKNALFAKNDAMSIAGELRIALAESEARSVEPRIAASDAARHFEAAHERACAAYARVQIYEALAQSSEALARAVALARHIRREPAIEAVADDLLQTRTAFVWKELFDLAATMPEAERMPHVNEIGVLDLGAFSDRNFVSIAKAGLMRKLAAAEAAAVIAESEPPAT